ncbi:hypothetical protein CDAR_298321 [Caerostris darwini]|uniref:Uncharacterized protein n=1 Tax=Caerostris darwini TaxID=1538125 RepID=A0AAV4TK00_9ARAC|nr:hypothetical protein CDAR_298321 [Caerostris darwini]
MGVESHEIRLPQHFNMRLVAFGCNSLPVVRHSPAMTNHEILQDLRKIIQPWLSATYREDWISSGHPEKPIHSLQLIPLPITCWAHHSLPRIECASNPARNQAQGSHPPRPNVKAY